jgi:hypothetical protein
MKITDVNFSFGVLERAVLFEDMSIGLLLIGFERKDRAKFKAV